MSSDIKGQVRQQLLSSVVSIWESRAIDMADKNTLNKRYEKLIDGANHLANDPRSRRSDPAAVEWKEKKKKEYDVIFDIGKPSSRHSSAPNTPLKRKSDEMVSKINSCVHF